MKTASGKLLFLFLGIFIGLIIAVFVFLLFSINNKPQNFIKNLMHRDTIVDRSLSLKKNIYPKEITKKKNTETTSETQAEEPQNQESEIRVDSSSQFNSADINDIQVRKDELLNILSIPLRDLDAPTTLKTSDSLLQKFEGNPTVVESKVYSVEFWKSPINYRGYKMIKTKIVLFGISPTVPIELKKIENKIYLKQNQLYYPLKQTDEFDAFKVLEDELKIKQLNK